MHPNTAYKSNTPPPWNSIHPNSASKNKMNTHHYYTQLYKAFPQNIPSPPGLISVINQMVFFSEVQHGHVIIIKQTQS